jgi:hypothetical protein
MTKSNGGMEKSNLDRDQSNRVRDQSNRVRDPNSMGSSSSIIRHHQTHPWGQRTGPVWWAATGLGSPPNAVFASNVGPTIMQNSVGLTLASDKSAPTPGDSLDAAKDARMRSRPHPGSFSRQRGVVRDHRLPAPPVRAAPRAVEDGRRARARRAHLRAVHGLAVRAVARWVPRPVGRAPEKQAAFNGSMRPGGTRIHRYIVPHFGG